MSGEIEFGANNLCATEEAFENFQANSMYEEDEFITLSDILPPQPKIPDLSTAIEEMPSENDIISSTFDDQCYPSGQTESHCDVNKVSTYTVDDTSSKSKRKPPGNAAKRRKRKNYSTFTKKKGKKSKTTINTIEGVSENFTDHNAIDLENVICGSEIKKDTTARTTHRQRRRTKKAATIENTENYNDMPPSEIVTSNEECPVFTSNVQELFTETEAKCGKRSQKRNYSRSPKCNSRSQSTASISTEGSPQKKRRGRPRKQKSEIVTVKNVIHQVENGDDMEKDVSDDDDISLSKLKETFEPMVSDISSLGKINECHESTAIDEKPADYKVNDFKNTDPTNETSLNKSSDTLKEVDSTVESIENNNTVNTTLPDVGPNSTASVQTEDTKKVKSSKRKSKSLLKSDYEYNVDKVMTENDENHILTEQNTSNVPVDNVSATEEDGSRRPTRKKAKQTHYEVESDEDPFANVELSDDEPSRNKKGYRYDFDDEYVPGGRHGRISTDSDSALDDNDDDSALSTKSKRKKNRKKSDIGSVNKSPKKKRKNSDEIFPRVTTITPDENCKPDDDIEGCLQSSVIKTSEETNQKPQSWGTTYEFESFLAKKIHGSDLKIKKVTASTSSDAVITPLEIPVLDPNETKKVKDIFTQTESRQKKTVSIQTTVPSMVPMKDNIALTPTQSENACEFLKSIVKTTAELGQLMTQKSEDFIKKKINTEHIKDTFKMDYCVNKSFLLLKLAKHNLTQMEEDLTKQYEEFLRVNNLLSCRQHLKKITPKPKATNSDSDCEIVGETTQVKKEKPKFNPKTVFLNKELSIKIAKKPTEETKTKEKMNIKGRHTVWISDSVMVKKVKPSQSFLAQDSRNKKPPDNFVTEKMVKDFFEDYYKKKSQSICAPFVATDWLSVEKTITCSYFFVNADKFSENTENSSENRLLTDGIQNENSNVNDTNNTKFVSKVLDIASPKTLLSLSLNALQKCLSKIKVNSKGIVNHRNDKVSHCIDVNIPETLLQLCLKNLLIKSGATDQEHEIVEKSIKFMEKGTAMEHKTLEVNSKNVNVKYLSQLNTPNTLVQLCIKTFSGNGFTNNVEIVDIYMSEQSLDKFKLKCNSFSKEHGNHMNEEYFISEEQIGNEHKLESSYESSLDEENHYTNNKMTQHNYLTDINTPESLFQLCIKTLSESLLSYEEPVVYDDKFSETETKFIILPLKILCLERIVDLLETTNKEDTADSKSLSHFEQIDAHQKVISDSDSKTINKSLFKICVEFIQHEQRCKIIDINTSSIIYDSKSYVAQSLEKIAFQHVTNLLYRNKFLDSTFIYANKAKRNHCYEVKSLANICFQCISTYFDDNKSMDTIPIDTMTINSVNTMSEEAFLKIAETDSDANNDLQYMADAEENNYDEDDFEENGDDFPEDSQTEDNNWVSQLQMEELRSCFMPSKLTSKHVRKDQQSTALEEESIVARIKIEPLDDIPENMDQQIVKTEPIHNLDEMTMIPENVVTKQETTDYLNNITEDSQRRESYDVHAFEAFIRSNKLMRSNDTDLYDEIFSQSTSRIRRQYEPDSDNENDIETNMSLLIPQTFEPLNIETAKGTLMESSSEEENVSNKKNTAKEKKKNEKRRGRPKKTDVKNTSSALKENVASKDNMARDKSTYSEVAMITRKMKERIRQEEKKNLSSDSENENVPLSKRKEKDVTDRQKSLRSGKGSEAEIQCNNVDSTEQIVDSSNNDNVESNTFSGFSAVDQNEIASYEKYMKYVYDKIIPKVVSEVKNKEQNMLQNVNPEDNNSSDVDKSYDMELPLINPDEPVELLECEPTMPIFETSVDKKVRRAKMGSKNIIKSKSDSKPKVVEEEFAKGKISEEKIVEKLNNLASTEQITEASVKSDETKLFIGEQALQITKEESIPEKEINITKSIKQEVVEVTNKKIKEKPIFIERHGWNCYPIATSDPKLYQLAHIPLERLPESFVDTYFQYQFITDKSKEDAEVDRLTNLQSLRRISSRDVKQRNKRRSKVSTDGQVISEQEFNSRPTSPVYSDHYAELTPSEDEGAADDEVSPPVENQATENCLAKNSLMNDNDSETEEQKPVENKTPTIKKEPADEVSIKKSRPGPKSKCKVNELSDSLMLTADKMMNKELTLLHAPIVLTDNVPETPTKGISPKTKQKTGSRSHEKKDRSKSGDESSEEEKQWVTTKEKLLKRLIKKQEDTSVDDAKRAKLVSEYIERRGALPAPDARIKSRGRPRRSKKKMLERQKQLSVLSRELFGESSMHSGKKHSQNIFKGRRNIRKVIDKKSLARSTVVANMEEFERKRRLAVRQSQLIEVLGCEEGVNVLVINDEVCLEYDFNEMRPVVTIHPFFTKVMKAHQYEGVKFMWDACFESLAVVESGHPGGGCILAHCMGLGKTLQVLALLHTVLTHPRVGMQRVLVCCPLSTVLNWVDEIHKWIGPVTNQIKVFELSKLKKTYERAYQLEDWYKGGGIFIIGYELFRSLSTLDPVLDRVKQPIINKIRTALLDPGPDIIICDEGHLLKNDCSVLAVAMSRVVTKRRIVLTGTPMQNNLREYYCMVNFVKPNLLGTYAEYSNRFENPIMNGQHRDSQEQDIKLMKTRTHILHKVLEGCLQRQEASVLYPYLPKKHEYTVFISLTKCQSVLYKHYLQKYANKSKQSILKDFHILQKIWSHPQVLHHFQMKDRDEVAKIKEEKLEDDLAREDLAASEDVKPGDTEVWWLQYLDGGNMLDSIESSNKFVAVFRILDECVALGDKVLIFSTSLFTMDALEYFLKKINNWSLGQEYYRLDGSVPAEVRQKWCREFNAENNIKTKLFLISTRAGSLGLNMTAANRVIILDTSWNPAHDIQSIFRVYRFGQKKDCYIYRLVALGTMEQKIYERSVTKQAVACRVVDEQQIDRHYNMAELTELYRFDELGVGVAGGVAVGVRDVVLLRVARDAALHAVHEHDSLLRGSSEQALNEHERDAAWLQFHEEYKHKESLAMNPVVKTPLKRLHSLDHHKEPPIIKQEIIKVEKDADYTPYEPKAKKGRKKALVNSIPDIPITVSPPVEDNSHELITSDRIKDKEEILVEKISSILIRHNFHSKRGPKEISELISNVRKIVASGRIEDLSGSDELTMSIANVLLQKEEPTMPPLTDVQQASTSTSSEAKIDRNEKKRGRPRKKTRVNQEEIPSTSHDSQEIKEDSLESDGRKKRRAALAAEKHLGSIAKDLVVDLDNDDDWQRGESDTEVITNDLVEPFEENVNQIEEKQKMPPAENKNKKYKPGPKSKKNLKSVVKTEKMDESYSQNQKTVNTDMESIILSDDDEPQEQPRIPEMNKMLEPKKQTVKKTEAAKNVMKTEVVEDVEKVPLHPSLLSNKNFIKIVAHTYLAGNPMLDEDAAILAAQYSTFRTLQELEATGKPIDSGPIYDIAVKVLGLPILKKLNKTSSKTGASTSKTVVEQPREQKITKEQEKNETRAKKVETTRTRIKQERLDRDPLIKINPKPTTEVTTKEINTPNLGFMTLAAAIANSARVEVPSKDAAHIASAKTAATPAVVPVGLIQSAVNVPALETSVGPHQSGDECILPDDDDLHIVSAPPPTPVSISSVFPTGTPVSTVNYPLHRSSHIENVRGRNQPLILNTVLAKGPCKTTLQSQTVQITGGKIVSKPSTSVQSNLQPSVETFRRVGQTLSKTISLDSDDEDETISGVVRQENNQMPTITRIDRINPHVVPVSLTKVNPMILSPNMPQSNQEEIVFDYNKPHDINQLNLNIQSVGPVQPDQLISILDKKKTIPSSTVNKLTKVSKSVVDAALKSKTQDTHKEIARLSDNVKKINSQSETTPVPTNTDVKNKTVCKPGDIIRIGKNGKLEILNRNDNPCISLDDDDSIITSNAKRTPTSKSSTNTLTRQNVPDHASSKKLIENEMSKVKKATSLNERPKANEKSISRVRNVSSSSSSSSSRSRSQSPSDPLSILKDVVHIRADTYEDPNKSRTNSKDATKSIPSSLVARKTTTTTSSLNPGKLMDLKNKTTVDGMISKTVATPSKVTLGTTKNKTITPSTSKNSTPTKPSTISERGDFIRQLSSKSDLILKKLNNILGSPNDNKRNVPVLKPKPTETVDLTGSASTSKVIDKLGKNIVISKTESKDKSPNVLAKTKTDKKESSSTVVGTSSTIILSAAGKTLKQVMPKTTKDSSSGRGIVRVTNMETLKPNIKASSDPKKRPFVSIDSIVPKKKKTEVPMTLKDFNLDDIDDIIELD